MRRKLQEARNAAKLSQKQVADRLGIGLRMYQYIESGEKLGAIRLWDALEDMLETPQRELREVDMNL